MKISLKKAHKILTTIKHSDWLSLYQERAKIFAKLSYAEMNQLVEKTFHKNEENLNNVLKLNEALFSLRRKIEIKNAESEINAKVSEKTKLKEQLIILSQFKNKSFKKEISDYECFLNIENEKEILKENKDGSQYIICQKLFSDETTEKYKKLYLDIQKKIENLDDELIILNTNLKVDLSEEEIEIFKKIEML